MAAYSDRVEAISFKLRDVRKTCASMKMLAADGELIVLGYDHHEPECCRCRELKRSEAHEFGCRSVQRVNIQYLIIQVNGDKLKHGV